MSVYAIPAARTQLVSTLKEATSVPVNKVLLVILSPSVQTQMNAQPRTIPVDLMQCAGTQIQALFANVPQGSAEMEMLLVRQLKCEHFANPTLTAPTTLSARTENVSVGQDSRRLELSAWMLTSVDPPRVFVEQTQLAETPLVATPALAFHHLSETLPVFPAQVIHNPSFISILTSINGFCRTLQGRHLQSACLLQS